MVLIDAVGTVIDVGRGWYCVRKEERLILAVTWAKGRNDRSLQ